MQKIGPISSITFFYNTASTISLFRGRVWTEL